MKYGRVSITPPSYFQENKAALQDLLEKGEITQEQFRLKLADLNREFGLFIARTNSYNPGRGRKGKQNLNEWREDFAKSRSLEIAQQVAKSLEKEPKTEITHDDLREVFPNIISSVMQEAPDGRAEQS